MLGSRDADGAGGFHFFQGFGFIGVVGGGVVVRGLVGGGSTRTVIQFADVVARAQVLDLARDFFERGAAFLQGRAGPGIAEEGGRAGGALG